MCPSLQFALFSCGQVFRDRSRTNRMSAVLVATVCGCNLQLFSSNSLRQTSLLSRFTKQYLLSNTSRAYLLVFTNRCLAELFHPTAGNRLPVSFNFVRLPRCAICPKEEKSLLAKLVGKRTIDAFNLIDAPVSTKRIGSRSMFSILKKSFKAFYFCFLIRISAIIRLVIRSLG